MSAASVFVLQARIAENDVRGMCGVLDDMNADIMRANSAEPYNHRIYSAVEDVYHAALELVFGDADTADSFARWMELGESHSHMIAGWMANEAFKADCIAEEIAAVNQDHVDGFHVARSANSSTDDFDYWISQGCRECAANR